MRKVQFLFVILVLFLLFIIAVALRNHQNTVTLNFLWFQADSIPVLIFALAASLIGALLGLLLTIKPSSKK